MSGGAGSARETGQTLPAMFEYPEAARYILDQIERAGLEDPRVIVRLTAYLAEITRLAAIAEIRREEGSWGVAYEESRLR